MAKKISVKEKVKVAKKRATSIEEVERRPIREPHSWVRITYNKGTHEYLYEVEEPTLSKKERKILEFIKKTLFKTLEYPKSGEIKGRRKWLERHVRDLLNTRFRGSNAEARERITYYAIRDFIGYGKIDALMQDEMVEDISCDGPNVPIFVHHQVYSSIRTNVVFPNDKALNSFVIALSQRCGKQISIADPLLEGTLADGSRVQASLAREVTTRGSSFTIRRFRRNPLTPPDLVRYNTLSPEMTAYCWLAVEYGDSIIASGGTACGKTSTINALSLFIPPQMKIVSIEDTREMNLPHENWIAGLTRSGFGGREESEVDMFQLVKSALRQRPQYIVVGEVRGKEAFTLFQAMATGHTTYSTMHADSVQSIVHRLENPPINLPRVLLTALNIIIIQSQVMVRDRLVRRVNEIVELVEMDPETNDLITNTVYEWKPATDEYKYLGDARLFEKIKEKKGLSNEEMDAEFKRRTEIIKWMVKKKVRYYEEVANIVSAYYKNPEKTMKRVEKELH